jgi:hypothetical protein
MHLAFSNWAQQIKVPKSLKSIEDTQMKEIKTLSDKHSQKEKDRQEKERIISAKES